MSIKAFNLYGLGSILGALSYNVSVVENLAKVNNRRDGSTDYLDAKIGSISRGLDTSMEYINRLNELGFSLDADVLVILIHNVDKIKSLIGNGNYLEAAEQLSYLAEGIIYVTDLYGDNIRDFPQSPLSAYDAIFGLGYYFTNWDFVHRNPEEALDTPLYGHTSTRVDNISYLNHVKTLKRYVARLTNYGLDAEAVTTLITNLETENPPTKVIDSIYNELIHSILHTFDQADIPPELAK